MSWLSDNAASPVPPTGTAAISGCADELAQTLEQRAKALTSPHSAAWLISHWLERCKGREIYVASVDPQGESLAAVPWQLSFYQVLLRSSAFEAVLEVCSRVPALRDSLEGDGGAVAGVGDGGTSGGRSLGGVMSLLAEQLLVPGALTFWPTLLEALLAEDLVGGPLPWGSWARRLLVSLKRSWQQEALPEHLRQLDERLRQLLAEGQAGEEASDGSADAAGSGCTTASVMLQQAQMGGGQRLSKQGIRAALTRRSMPRLAAEAKRLREHTAFLCNSLELLKAVGSQGMSNSKEVRQLLEDATLACSSLGVDLKNSNTEHKDLEKTKADDANTLQRQIATLMITQESLVERRGRLQDERSMLMQRLQELDGEVLQLDDEVKRCQHQIQQLQAKDSHNYNGYDSSSGCTAHKQVIDRKTQAVSFQECARAAVEATRTAEDLRIAELSVQEQRRMSELRHQCIAYLRKERQRLDSAGECGALNWAATGEDGNLGDELTQVTATAQEVRHSSQDLLERVDELRRPAFEDCRAKPVRAAAAPAVINSGSASEASDFFAQVSSQGLCFCADCDGPAEWASISYGTYLCLDCAGRHRGLGVHLSFVRSLTMDRWTLHQLRSMQLGGSNRFREYLEGYPELASKTVSSLEALRHRYMSRAASFYRRRLAAECSDSQLEQAPPVPEEGHLQEVESGGESTHADVSSDMDGDDALELERQELETTFLDLQRQLQEAQAI